MSGRTEKRRTSPPCSTYRSRKPHGADAIRLGTSKPPSTTVATHRSATGVESEGDGVRLDLFSPLPQWSERRLMILGRRVAHDRCLFSYIIPANEAGEEEAFLQRNLWLSCDEGSQ